MTPEEAARWIYTDRLVDGLGGEFGTGWSQASTADVAEHFRTSIEEAYKELARAAKKGLIYRGERSGFRGASLAGRQRQANRGLGLRLWEVSRRLEDVPPEERDTVG